MILFTILLITLAIITVLTVLAVSVLGATGIVLFGDVIVCAIFIIWVMKKLLKRKK